MIDFMVIGFPRSATTWAANWLTTDFTFCLHDPLYKMHYSEWQTNKAHFPQRRFYRRHGVSCTGIWRWPEWVNEHPARKVVLVRDLYEVQLEMERLGLPFLPDNSEALLSEIDAPRIDYSDLFISEKASELWSHLIQSFDHESHPFCPHRHSLLCELNVQPNFQKIEPDKAVTRKLYNELLMR